jgi:hypothetical protein
MKYLTLLLVCLISFSAYALPIKRQFRDMKLVTQQLIEKQTITNPAAAAASDILSADLGNSSAAAATQTTFAAQPDVTRSISITPSGTTADVAACTVAVAGTDFHGQSISEDFFFAENRSTIHLGTKAFKSVTSVTFPANCEDSPFSATWEVGYGEKLGLKRCLDSAGHLVMSTASGAKEGTEPTMASDAANIEGNTADVNGTMDGAADFEIFFFQNFAQSCYP